MKSGLAMRRSTQYKKAMDMDDAILFTELNDFIFCPISIEASLR